MPSKAFGRFPHGWVQESIVEQHDALEREEEGEAHRRGVLLVEVALVAVDDVAWEEFPAVFEQ